jgi:hypothetical protein
MARNDAEAETPIRTVRIISDRWAELDRLADLSTDILYDAGDLIHATPYRAGFYNERTPLMLEIRAEGIDL